MTEKFEGECKGGPLDGQCLAHWARTKKFYRPMIAFATTLRNLENERIEPVEIGEYRLNDYGQWHWWGTKDGAAYDQLFGAARQS